MRLLFPIFASLMIRYIIITVYTANLSRSLAALFSTISSLWIRCRFYTLKSEIIQFRIKKNSPSPSKKSYPTSCSPNDWSHHEMPILQCKPSVQRYQSLCNTWHIFPQVLASRETSWTVGSNVALYGASLVIHYSSAIQSLKVAFLMPWKDSFKRFATSWF